MAQLCSALRVFLASLFSVCLSLSLVMLAWKHSEHLRLYNHCWHMRRSQATLAWVQMPSV
ncbi:hypothetical protein CGQ25_11265 [Sinomonas sp. R1AF57]|nr:hypothetical protein CGQ25_11265 [Sinomonas sp. R1AF57]